MILLKVRDISCYKYRFNGSVLVMQLCLLVIAIQVCTCYINNQLLQKENISVKHQTWTMMDGLSDENI